MRITAITDLSDVERHPRRIAIGTFDGIHLGHRDVIAGTDTVLTFEPHPRSVTAPGSEPPRLIGVERKAELVAELGVKELVVIAFDKEFSQREATEFIDHVIVATLQARTVAVGQNFRFGARARGDAALLAADSRFATRIVQLFEVDGEVVSASHIRSLVADGSVDYAARLLGREFDVTGEVAHGDKRGRTLGFPTANLVPQPGFLVPGRGVYAARVVIDPGGENQIVPAAASVGLRPQFETDRGELIEAFLLDWSGDLYGRQIRVEFVRRLRGERRFESVAALVEQMNRDVETTRGLLI